MLLHWTQKYDFQTQEVDSFLPGLESNPELAACLRFGSPPLV